MTFTLNYPATPFSSHALGFQWLPANISGYLSTHTRGVRIVKYVRTRPDVCGSDLHNKALQNGTLPKPRFFVW